MAWTYTKAVVIDDALGPPTAGSVASDDKDLWVEFVLGNEGANEQLMEAYKDLKPASVQSLLEVLTASTGYIQNLWDCYQKAQLPEAGLEKLFATESLNRQATSEKAVLVREFLIKEIGPQNVQTFYDLPSAQEALAVADLAFVDFFLDKNEGPKEALDRIRKHKDILCKPSLVFFMSSRANIDTQQRVREEIHMRSAFFEVMDKSNITEDFIRDKLDRKVTDFEANKALEQVVITLAKSIKDAVEKLEEATETLEIHDLTLLNLARLEAEGESLPEYLTWLFSEFVAAQARRNSKGAKLVALNPKQVGFTGQLRQATVLFELFSEIVFSPGRNSKDPLQFGEVLQLQESPNEHILLLTPACDFARCDSDIEVLCVRGVAAPFDGPKSHASQRLYGKAGSVLCHLRLQIDTDTSGRKYSMITWDTKSAFTKPMSVLKGDAYVRVQVMNELFAQEVKEEALRSLGRVGTQINPPPAASLKATARWRVGKEQAREVTTPENEFLAALVMYSERPVLGKEQPDKGPLIVLSDAFRTWIKREIESSFGSEAIENKLSKCIMDLNQEHFQAKLSSFQFKQNDLFIRIQPTNEPLPDKLTGLLEITLWFEP